MILKIDTKEGLAAIKYYYQEVKGFNIGNVTIVRDGLKGTHFELSVVENKDLPVEELKSINKKIEIEDEPVRKKKAK